MKKALLLVDIQNDFLPTGKLPVPNGDEILPIVNRILPKFDLVVATQDWHPEHHKSFASQHEGKNIGEFIDLHGVQQILWPDHCVQGAEGAELAEGLNKTPINKVIQKGLDVNVDSYSGFFDNDHISATGMDKYLKIRKITDVYVVGLALDYCVKYTAIDSAGLGFKTTLIRDASRAVNMTPGDDQTAIEEMKRAGVSVITSTEL